MKKTLSLLLVIVMVIGMLPLAAFADTAVPAISFETDFEEDMIIGDTFTITANMDSNPGISAIGMALTWNTNAVQFTGFEKNDRNRLLSDVFLYESPTVNYDEGIVTWAASDNIQDTGSLFTAKFEVVGYGDLNIGFETMGDQAFHVYTINEDKTQSNLTDATYAAIDWSDVKGLKVPNPNGVPFVAKVNDRVLTDITVGAVTSQDWSNGGATIEVPAYTILLPAGTKSVDFTFEGKKNWNYYNKDGVFLALGQSNATDEYTIEVKDVMKVGANGLAAAGADGELDGVSVQVVGTYSAEYYIFFEYPAAPKHNITVGELEGGTITVTDAEGNPITEAAEGETVYVTVSAAEGYSTTNAYYINGELANDLLFQMPAKDVVLTADFTKVETHTCTFAEVVADKFLKSEATCESGAVYYKSCTCGEKSEDTFVSGDPVACSYGEDGKCIWCGEAEVVVTSYTVEMKDAEVSVVTGETVTVPVKIGYTTEAVKKYNAFDLTFTYDAAALELTSTEITGMSVSAEGGVIKVARYGAEQDLGTALTLTFKALKPAESEVKLTAAKVDISNKALANDAPDATILNATTLVKVTNYTVDLPEGAQGETTVAPEADYTFTVNKIDGYDYKVTATMGGEPVDVLANEDGSYTIEGVTGNIVISVKQTAKEYKVTLGEDLDGAEKAQYMTAYTATLTKEEGYTYKVTVTIGGADYTGFTYVDETGVVTIPGKDITGEIEISSGKEAIPATEYSVTFEGSGAGDAEGATKVKEGETYSFKLNKVEGYEYEITATMDGETIELTEAAGTYTTPAATGPIVITIEKVEQSDLEVSVYDYVTLNNKTMFLVTATKTLAEGEALAYNGTVMFDAAQYEAWAYLVITEGTLTVEDATAMITVVTAEHTDLAQTYDVNMTGTEDINDAQLVYDMYNTVYQDFDAATMQKFLNADVNVSYDISVDDAAAVVAYILTK